jgi:hypothetical protein
MLRVVRRVNIVNMRRREGGREGGGGGGPFLSAFINHHRRVINVGKEREKGGRNRKRK